MNSSKQVSHNKSLLVIYFAYGNICVPMIFCQLAPPSPSPLYPQVCDHSLCPQVCSPCVYLHCCSESRFISTIFLDSMLLLSHPVVSDSLWPHGLQHSRSFCTSPETPEVCPSSCPLHWWYHPAISSSDALFSFYLQSFPALGTFPMSHLFVSDDQNPGASASASVLPISVQDWFPLRLIDLISLLSKGLSEVQRHYFVGFLPSLLSSSHSHMDYWEDHSLHYNRPLLAE